MKITILEQWKSQLKNFRNHNVIMRMRDVSPNLKNFILHPAMTIECIYVPLMMAASKTADELTVASVTRGIENPTQRTSYVRIGFGIADLIVVLAFLAMFLVGQFYGEVF